MPKSATDLQDRRRRCAVDLARAREELAAAVKDRDAAVRADTALPRVAELTRRVDALVSDVAVLTDRQSSLTAEAVKHDLAAAEAARSEGIDQVLQPHVDIIVAAAERLERAIADVSAADTALGEAAAALYAKWPAAVPHDPFYRWSLADVRQRLGGAAKYAAVSGEFSRLAEWCRSYGERTTPLSESVRRALTSHIRNLREVPLPAPSRSATAASEEAA